MEKKEFKTNLSQKEAIRQAVDSLLSLSKKEREELMEKGEVGELGRFYLEGLEGDKQMDKFAKALQQELNPKSSKWENNNKL